MEADQEQLQHSEDIILLCLGPSENNMMVVTILKKSFQGLA